MKNFIILICLALLSSEEIKTQDNNYDEAKIASYFFSLGESSGKQANYDSSVIYYRQGCVIYERLSKKKPELAEKLLEGYNEIGEAFWRQGKLKSARGILDSALYIGENVLQGPSLQLAVCYSNIGIVNEGEGEYNAALQYYRKSLHIKQTMHGVPPKEIAGGLMDLGIAFRRLSEYDSSLSYYSKSLEIFKTSLGELHTRIGYVLINLGNVYLEKAEYGRALQLFDSALIIFKHNIENHNLAANHPNVGSLYVNIGRSYHFQFDYERALEFYFKAMRVYTESLGSKHMLLANVYDNIGVVYYTTGNYQKSLEYVLKGLVLREELGHKHPELFYSYNSLGQLYFKKGDYELAWHNYKLAEDIVVEKQGHEHSNISSLLIDMGNVLARKGEWDQARQFYYKSLAIAHSRFKGKHHTVSLAYVKLSEIYENKNIDSALYFIQKSVISASYNFDDININSNPSIQDARNDEDLFEALGAKVKLLKRKADASSAFEDLKLVYLTALKALDLSDQMRKGYKSERHKIDVGNVADKIYDCFILTALQLYKLTNNEEYHHAAFTYSERNKSGILLDAVFEARAKRFSGIPDSLIKEEEQLKASIIYNEMYRDKEISKQTGGIDKTFEIEERIFALKESYDKLVKTFETQYPDYHNLRYVSSSTSISDIQSRLIDSNSALVEYYVGDSTLIIFVILKDKYESVILPKDSTLERSIFLMRKSLFNIEINDYVKVASRLYKQLIEPIQHLMDGTNKMYVIPHGILNYLPFEALLTKDIKNISISEFDRFPYLLRSYSIGYLYSASLRLQQLNRTRRSNTSQFVGFAPVFSDSVHTLYVDESRSLLDTSVSNSIISDLERSVSVNGKTFSELRYSENELRDIATLFKDSLHARIYLHKDATKQKLMSPEMNQYKYMHIATHGFINESNPKLSGIIFSVKDSSDDGILHSGEMYNLTINPDLVILSACESGLGNLVKGEGIISLTRGFIYSGARNLIVSLWQVRDQSTAILMKEVYKGILEGKEYAEALRDAKLKMINSGLYAYPLDWSPFILIGQ